MLLRDALLLDTCFERYRLVPQLHSFLVESILPVGELHELVVVVATRDATGFLEPVEVTPEAL